MNANELKSAREELGLTRKELGISVGTKQDGFYTQRTVMSWELEERAVPPAVAKVVRLLLRAKRAE